MGEDPLDAASTSAAATACRGCVGLGVVTAGYLVAPAILVVVAVVAPYRQAVVAAETVERARVTEVRKAEFPLQSSPRAVCGSAA